MTTTLHTLLAKCFQTQDAVNRAVKNSQGEAVGAEWTNQGWHYYRAAWTEAAECVMHLNWIWWKRGEYNQPLSEAQLAEVHIELCDVFHFVLSQDIVFASQSGGEARITARIKEYEDAFAEAAESGRARDLSTELEEFIAVSILARTSFSPIKAFARACTAADLSLADLLMFYYGKAALNRFRQDNGYNQKTYRKQWPAPNGGEGTVEDNTYLARFIGKVRLANSGDSIANSLADGTFERAATEYLGNEYAKATKT